MFNMIFLKLFRHTKYGPMCNYLNSTHPRIRHDNIESEKEKEKKVGVGICKFRRILPNEPLYLALKATYSLLVFSRVGQITPQRPRQIDRI